MPIFDDTGRQALKEIRARREGAAADRAELVARRAASKRELDALLARHGQDEVTHEAAVKHQHLVSELIASREQMKAARSDLRDLILKNLPDTPEDDVAELDGSDPIILLPVRLETRFVRAVSDDDVSAGVLRVRIYPDAIAAKSHEPRLSENEREAGFDYWRAAWRNADEADAWTALLEDVPAPRAAWVVQQTTPTNYPARFPTEPPGDAGEKPTFPAVDIRPPNWQDYPSTNVLPDRWVVLGYREFQEVRRAVSRPILEPLALTLRIGNDGDEPELDDSVDVSNGLEVDDEVLWTVDFNRAVEVGMAVEMQLTEEDFEKGFQQVLCLGVKGSLDPSESAERLGTLFDAHHYTRGFSFVPQGTPTNNVSETPSGFPPADPRGEASFRTERGVPLVDAETETDGTRFARALGLSIDHVAHVWGAERDEQAAARAMAYALWPSTLGYFLEHLMRPVVSDEGLREAQRYFVDHVRARGHYPAFRVGDVPYGLLPVTFIHDWESDHKDNVERELKPLVITALNLFSRFLVSTPHVNRSNDADRDLLETLGMDASAREVWLRCVLGADTTWNFVRSAGIDPARMEDERKVIAQRILEGLGHPDWDPRILYTNFSDPPYRFAKGLVVNDPDDPLSETDTLDFNYINWLRTRGSITAIRDQQFPDGLTQRPQSLLYLMLRHGALQLYTRSALDLLIGQQLAQREVLFERELIQVTSETRDAATVWDHMTIPVPGVTAGQPVDRLLSLDEPRAELPPLRTAFIYRATLAELEQLSTAELERLFTETLDTCSHRVDAWTTSMVARRLQRIRKERPNGCHLAAYGWVEHLQADRPAHGRAETINDERVFVRDDSGGYVYAPSMTHGAVAAVLLNAYLTRQGPAKDRYAVNLSSRRTRVALEVLDAVRNGQALGAVLGYQFERGLHEGHPNVELDEFIDDFREAYPIALDQNRDANDPVETIAARNVVDGLALRHAWRGEPGFTNKPWETIEADQVQRTAVEAELENLDATVDAVADFLLADSVFQVVSGKMDAAGASLNAVGGGARPPEGDFAKVPRTGTALTHRMAIVLGGDGVDVSGTWGGPHHERARAEPSLNGWVGRLLGDPSNVECEVRFDAANSVSSVTLDQLSIDPLDVLALARAAHAQSADSELDRRVRTAVTPAVAMDEPFEIRYAPEGLGAGRKSFLAILELARSINELLGAARPLEPGDLIPAEASEDLQSDDPAIAPDLMPIEMSDRAVAAKSRFDAQRDDLDTTLQALIAVPDNQPGAAQLHNLRAALRAISAFGIANAYPRTFDGSTAAIRQVLTEQAESVLAEADRRQARFAEASESVDKLNTLFGREFVVLPRFRPARPDALQPALDEPPIVATNASDTNKTLSTWFAQISRIRKALGPWRRIQQYARSLDHQNTDRHLVQIPFEKGARWVGLPFDNEDQRPLRGRVSIQLYRAQTPAANAPWVGLMLDEWMETIPSVDEDVGVVFHHDSPGAEAPQAVLIAVPPMPIKRWSFDLLVNILQQTLLHAKIRGVDRENAAFLYGQLVPMIYLTQNTRSDAVSTVFDIELLEQAYFFRGQ